MKNVKWTARSDLKTFGLILVNSFFKIAIALLALAIFKILQKGI